MSNELLRDFALHVLNEQLSFGEHGDAEYIRMAIEALNSSKQPAKGI